MEARITELEIRLVLQDELLDDLNQIIARQQQQIDHLQQQVSYLQERSVGPEQSGRSLLDEIPPHY
ncbi:MULTISPECIES: SlyX family protein [Deefgea]|uniref:SlyX family protein n=1 Tax=Deefgea piscis TaxID=2739061 RepID=A0A6M8SS92_9NEIS|nr:MULTISPECIES: SlyX family protein [Deefgea]MBM5574215.1 SlyX protein [Deefgea sp. CFH1-16]QKJ66186.1 SlyX family protein [Deefgea piscis]QZA81327.1 SlyX family protein [Deefgea piscis]